MIRVLWEASRSKCSSRMTASVVRTRSMVYLIDLVRVVSLAARWAISLESANLDCLEELGVFMDSLRQFKRISSSFAKPQQVLGIVERAQGQQASAQGEE